MAIWPVSTASPPALKLFPNSFFRLAANRCDPDAGSFSHFFSIEQLKPVSGRWISFLQALSFFADGPFGRFLWSDEGCVRGGCPGATDGVFPQPVTAELWTCA
jgi:hypothetical protein